MMVVMVLAPSMGGKDSGGGQDGGGVRGNHRDEAGDGGFAEAAFEESGSI